MYDTLIGTDALAANIERPDWVIIDCRFSLSDTNAGRNAYNTEHIINAIYAHLDEDLSGEIITGKTGRHPLPNIGLFTQKLSDWGIDNNTQVIAYDDKGGAIAARLWWLLKWLGHQRVAVLNGGWQTWRHQQLPTDTRVPSPQPKKFTPHLQSKRTISKKEIAIQTGNTPLNLVDSRGKERYLGINEPIDPVAGHIPGAINLPFSENLDENGLFLPVEDLQRRFKAIQKPNTPVFYCGSGVTACHNILAYEYCGYGQALLYPGSWSEWIVGFE